MAAGSLPEPGTEYGPCKDGCAHKDCAETRKMAAAICWRCEKAIAYNRRFYRMHDGTEAAAGEPYFVHALCEETAAESEGVSRV